MENNLLFEIDEEKEKRDLEKYANFFFLLHFWMQFIEDGKSVNEFFYKRGYRKIAVYGMGHLGKHLIAQLSDKLEVVYTIDQGLLQFDGEKYQLDKATDIVPKAEVIVVTPVMDYCQIKRLLKKSVDIDIVSLEEVILSI